MLKKLTKTAAALGLAATLTACGVTGGPLIREGEPVGMTIFSDGRVFVHGMLDASRARAINNRWLGG